MKANFYEINLHKGLSTMRFGATFEEAVALLGEPSEVESLENEVNGQLETLLCFYNDSGLTLFFEGGATRTLSCVETDNHNMTLFGRRIFEMTEDEVIALMQANGYSELFIEMEAWGEKRVSFDDALIDFYFENGKLVTVNWGIEVDDD